MYLSSCPTCTAHFLCIHAPAKEKKTLKYIICIFSLLRKRKNSGRRGRQIYKRALLILKRRSCGRSSSRQTNAIHDDEILLNGIMWPPSRFVHTWWRHTTGAEKGTKRREGSQSDFENKFAEKKVKLESASLKMFSLRRLLKSVASCSFRGTWNLFQSDFEASLGW